MSYLDKHGIYSHNLKNAVDSICDSYTESSGCKDCPMRGVRTIAGDKVCVECEDNEELLAYESQIMEALGLEHETVESYEEKPASDAVNHPSHYNQGGIECIDALDAMVTGYPDPVAAALTWQVGKYIWRHPFKEKPLEDLKKARFYLDRLIALHEEART